VKLQVADGWDAAVDDYGMGGPQIAVIRIIPPGFDQSNPGDLPNISVIVEDVSREGMSLSEYKDKSKEYASNASAGGMMGMMVAPPTITKDEAVSIGRFRHTLEYTQVFPNPAGYVPYQFMNLMTMHNGLAYVVQYMSRADKFSEYRTEATNLAKTMVIEDLPPRPASRIEFTSSAHKVQLSFPETWNVVKENKEEDGRCLIVALNNGASHRPDAAVLYKLNSKCSSPSDMITKYAELIKASPTAKPTVEKVAHSAYFEDRKQISIFSNGEYLIVVKPEGTDATTHSIPTSTITAIFKSIKPTSEIPKSKAVYINTLNRFSFQVIPNSRLVEHKWGDTSATYAPIAADDDQGANLPVFTVAVNKEPEPYSDLSQVEARITSDNDPSTPIADRKIEKVGATDFLSFVLSREESASGPFGPREEFKSKIMIGLRGNETVMLKWEIAANEWVRYERYLTAILDSFQML
jgi:hypothetical protein